MNAKHPSIADLLNERSALQRKITQRRHDDQADFEAMLAGKASLDQYRRVASREVNAGLARWLPTLTLAEAARRFDIRPGERPDDISDLYLPGDVLSYRPDDTLPRALRVRMAKMKQVLKQTRSDPAARTDAAIARLIIGPDLGQLRRAWAWSGRCQAAAKRTYCRYETWWDTGLVKDWGFVNALIDARQQRLGRTKPDDHYWKMTYERVVGVLDEHHRGQPTDKKASLSGQ